MLFVMFWAILRSRSVSCVSVAFWEMSEVSARLPRTTGLAVAVIFVFESVAPASVASTSRDTCMICADATIVASEVLPEEVHERAQGVVINGSAVPSSRQAVMLSMQ